MNKNLLNIEVIREFITKRKVDWTIHYPSCLILGYNINYKKIHIVCGISSDTVHMITAYYPDTNYWEKDMKTRREK